MITKIWEINSQYEKHTKELVHLLDKGKVRNDKKHFETCAKNRKRRKNKRK